MSEFLRSFARQFSALNKDNLQRLGELYSDDIHFTDPLHEVQGWRSYAITSVSCTPTSASCVSIFTATTRLARVKATCAGS